MNRIEVSSDPWPRVFRLFYTQFERSRILVDEEGIPKGDYGRRLWMRVGPRRVAVGMGITGLKATQSGSLVGLAEFDKTADHIVPYVNVENMARWLLDSSIDRGDYMVFHYDFPWPNYLLRPPWRSCLAEAFAGMFLIVHGRSKGIDQYVDCGLKHLRSLTVPVSKGGLKSDKSTTFLEYVDYETDRRFPIVLNGHLYCMITLYNASRILNIPEFRVSFEEAVSELERLLPVFEGPFFTYYDNYGNPATAFYNEIHIHLLEKLHELTKQPYLNATARSWRRFSGRYNFALSLFARAYTMRIPYLPRR
jgi:hypothetical protein